MVLGPSFDDLSFRRNVAQEAQVDMDRLEKIKIPESNSFVQNIFSGEARVTSYFPYPKVLTAEELSLVEMVTDPVNKIWSDPMFDHRSDGGSAAGAAAGSLAVVEASDSTKARMSFFVTRPSRPVPGIVLGSMPCSAAIRATTGETNVCRSSEAPLP